MFDIVCSFPRLERRLDETIDPKKSYPVTSDRAISISSLKPGTIYITYLIAGDGIESETASDPQLITTLVVGKLYCERMVRFVQHVFFSFSSD